MYVKVSGEIQFFLTEMKQTLSSLAPTGSSSLGSTLEWTVDPGWASQREASSEFSVWLVHTRHVPPSVRRMMVFSSYSKFKHIHTSDQ